MRKGILLLLFIFIALLFAIPFLDGYFFKSTFIKQISAIENKSFKIEIEKYDLGWLSSDVKLNIIPRQKNKVLSNNFTIDGHISHGPLAYDDLAKTYVFAFAAISGKFHLPSEFQKLFASQGNNQLWMISQTKVNFNNVWEQTVSFPAQVIPNIGTIEITNSNSIYQFMMKNNIVTQWNVNGESGAIHLRADANNILIPDASVRPFTFNQISIRQPNGLWNSDSKLSTPNIALKWKQGDSISINNLSMNSVSGVDLNNLYNYNYALSTGKIEVQNKWISAFSPLTAKLNFTLNNLSPAGLSDYYDFIGKSGVTGSTEQERLMLNKLNKWSNIFTVTSTMNINMIINTSLGASSAQLKYSLKPGMDVPHTVDEAKKSMLVEVNTRIAAPLLNKIIEMKFAEKNAAVKKQIDDLQVKQQSNKIDQTSIETTAVDLLRQGKISLQLSMSVIDMAHKNISMNEFTQDVNAGTSPETAALLIQAYKNTLPDEATTQLIASQNALPTPQQSVDETQKVIDQWIQQGYLMRDNNDYISTIIYDGGILKMNNKDMSEAIPINH